MTFRFFFLSKEDDRTSDATKLAWHVFLHIIIKLMYTNVEKWAHNICISYTQSSVVLI